MVSKLLKQHTSFTKFLLIYLCCIAVALAIRLPYFSQIPEGLNRDEAALGYNAYSLLKIGKDEFGQPWPIKITSFGDQKLPGYVYALIPFIAAFDITTTTIRLPSFLSGLVVIAAVGVLAVQLGSKIFSKPQQITALSTTAMLFVAVSPWANHFSRVAYEAHLAMVFGLVGLCAYLAAVETTQVLKQRLLLSATAVAWSLSLMTYHAYHIFIPLLVAWLLFFTWVQIKKFDQRGMLVASSLGIIAVVILVVGGIFQANSVKNKGITPFNKADLQIEGATFRQQLPGEDAFYEKVLINPITEAIVRFSQNILRVPSGDFLFISGTGHGDHNPGNMNLLHLYVAPFLILGFFILWEARQNPTVRSVWGWVVVSSIPSALTISPQHTVRFSAALPVLELVAAVGVVYLWSKCAVRWQKLAFTFILLLLIIFSVIRQMLLYLYVAPTIESHQNYELLAQAIARYKKPTVTVITQSPSSSPYIWYAVQSKYDPTLFQKDIERYPTDSGGFQHVRRIDNVYFETVDWNDLRSRAHSQELILIFKSKEIPGDLRTADYMHLLEVIKDTRGTVQYEVWSMKY